MVDRTCILVALSCSLLSLLAIRDVGAEAKQEQNKWHLEMTSGNSESEITSNYVSRETKTKDSAVVSYPVDAVELRKNQFKELQAKIQKQLPKESKFFDEFEGSEC